MEFRGERAPQGHYRERLHQIIFEADTPAGRAFDIALLWAIVISVCSAVFDSVRAWHDRFGDVFLVIEWVFTVLFTVEYALRLAAVRRPLRYATSFFGVVDLLALIPTYVSVLVPGAQSLPVVRVLRLLRVFRIFKLAGFLGEAEILMTALRASRRKITVFLGAVLSIVTVTASLMYVVEGPENGFDSIPRAMYWAIVTLTTVGFGDITPKTVLGQAIASLLMIVGYGVIAVPTGIVSAELAQVGKMRTVSTQTCPSCSFQGHDADAGHCKRCGSHL